ncbi:MAG: aldose epimerase family protein [Bacteroidota bacterium]
MTKEKFGITREGREVYQYRLVNRHGMEVCILTYGGIISSLVVPDRKGTREDVVLGYDTLDGYLGDRAYMGAIIGRCANRIAGGRFMLEGVEYTVTSNAGRNHLHGGARGFDKVLWEVDERASDDGTSLVLRYRSRDGEEGYPGNLAVRVAYSLTEENDLFIEYAAAADRTTIINLTQHSYFNLAGAGRGDILGHELFIDADKFTPIREDLIPTGEIRAVSGTPMDFRKPCAIGKRMGSGDEQLALAGGYDLNWVLNPGKWEMHLAAIAHEKTSGRFMGVFTSEPGLQFYTGNFLDGTAVGKGSVAYARHAGFCLETQHFPDSANHAGFPPVTLERGRTFQSTTVFRFTVR